MMRVPWEVNMAIHGAKKNREFELIKILFLFQTNIELTPLRFFNHSNIFELRWKFERNSRQVALNLILSPTTHSKGEMWSL